MTEEEAFGWTIQQKRELLGLTVNELARETDISPGYVYEFERGVKANISLRLALRLARRLDLSLDALK